MRFIDDAARINHQNWNKGGKFENHYGAQEVLHVNPEDFRAFLEGRVERLASGMSIRVEGSVGFGLHDELSDLSGAAKRARLSCPVQQEHRSPPIGPGEDDGHYQ